VRDGRIIAREAAVEYDRKQIVVYVKDEIDEEKTLWT